MAVALLLFRARGFRSRVVGTRARFGWWHLASTIGVDKNQDVKLIEESFIWSKTSEYVMKSSVISSQSRKRSGVPRGRDCRSLPASGLVAAGAIPSLKVYPRG